MKSVFPMILKALLCCLIVCLCLVSPATAFDNDTSKEDIINALEKKYGGKSFEAAFKQVSTLTALDITEIATGKAQFSYPGKMKWSYETPERHDIITNGKSLWIFRPDENQVMQGDASHFFKSGAGGAFLSDIHLVRKKYAIQIKEITADYAELSLIAKEKNPEISSIVIRITNNNEIIKVITMNAYDDTTRFDFSDIQFKPMDPDIFEFSPPEGSNIIDMD